MVPSSGATAGYEQLGSRLRTPVCNEVAVAGGPGVGITDGVGNAAGAVAAASGFVGQKFRIDTTIFTVVNGVGAIAMDQNGPAVATATFDMATGGFVFVGAAINSQIYFYDYLTAAVTDGIGDAKGIVPGTKFLPGQMFSIGTELFTVQATGTPVGMLTNSATATTMNFNTTTGEYEFVNVPWATKIYFYPAQPVMGIVEYELSAINDELVYCFDTQFAYHYIAGAWTRLGTGLWTGSDKQFFWGQSYRGTAANNSLIFITNNSSTDNVRYWDGAAWTTFTPRYTTAVPADRIKGCRVILSFKNRLLFFNTYESEKPILKG